MKAFVVAAAVAVALTGCRHSGTYPSCAAAQSAGAAPLHRGDKGYSAELDADGDGIACEVTR